MGDILPPLLLSRERRKQFAVSGIQGAPELPPISDGSSLTHSKEIGALAIGFAKIALAVIDNNAGILTSRAEADGASVGRRGHRTCGTSQFTRRRYHFAMAVCPRCRTAFLEGEVHRCTRRSRRTIAVWSALAALYAIAYAVMSYQQGRLVNPAAVVLYMFVLLGLSITAVIHLLLTTLHLAARR